MSHHIRKICTLFIILSLCATGLFVYWALTRNSDFEDYEENVNKTIALGNEMRADLVLQGNYARTLVIQGHDTNIEQNLQRIAAQQEGNEPRPLTSSIHPGVKISLKNIIDALQIPDSIKEKLHTAYKTLANIAVRDIQAVRLAQGYYLDATGLYSIRGEPDPVQAKELVFSPESTTRIIDLNNELASIDNALLQDLAAKKAQAHMEFNYCMFAACLSFFLALILFGALSLRGVGSSRLMTTYVLIMLCLIVLVTGPSAMVFTSLEPFVQKANVTRIEGMAEAATQDLHEKLNGAMDFLAVIASHEDVVRFMTYYRASPTYLEENTATLASIEKAFHSVETHYGNLSSLTLISLDRAALLATGRGITDCAPFIDSRAMLALMDGEAQIIPLGSAAVKMSGELPHGVDERPLRAGLGVAVPILREDSNTVVGILMGTMCQTNALALWRSRIMSEKGIVSFALDADGNKLNFIGDSETSKAIAVPEGLRNFVKTGSAGLYSTESMNYFVARTGDPNWMIVIGSSTLLVEQDVRYIMADTILYTVLAILVGIMLISLPLQQLTGRLHHSLERLTGLIKETGMFTWEYNFRTETVTYSEQFVKMLGYDVHTHPLQNSRDWLVKTVHPKDWPLLQQVKSQKNAQHNVNIEIRIKNAENDWIWVMLLGYNEKADAHASKDSMVGTGYDVTARKLMEQTEIEAKQRLEKLVRQRTSELEESRNQAEAASKTKSEFLSTVSHEIRTPMNAIMGFTHLFHKDNLTREQVSYLEKIQMSADTLLNIINDVLDISKIESGKLEIEKIPFSLDVLLDSMQSIANFSVKSAQSAQNARDVEFHMHVTDSIPRQLVGDGKRVSQVVLNLLNNAFKFTEKGSVTLEIMRDDILAGGRAQDTVTLTFSVRDTGIGLTKEQRNKLFRPFMQADSSITRRFGGTGLGLAICKQLVELMGGSIGVHSVYGEGSCFYFTLPFTVYTQAQGIGLENEGMQVPTTPLNMTHAELEEALKAYTHKNILLVEDNFINQEIASSILANVGFECDLADNGQESLAAVQKKRYDIIFMDLQMPVMGGLEASAKLRLMGKDAELAWLSQVPIIAMTANAMVEDKVKCTEAGMDAHVSKPIDPTVLYRELLIWLSK